MAAWKNEKCLRHGSCQNLLALAVSMAGIQEMSHSLLLSLQSTDTSLAEVVCSDTALHCCMTPGPNSMALLQRLRSPFFAYMASAEYLHLPCKGTQPYRSGLWGPAVIVGLLFPFLKNSLVGFRLNREFPCGVHCSIVEHTPQGRSRKPRMPSNMEYARAQAKIPC